GCDRSWRAPKCTRDPVSKSYARRMRITLRSPRIAVAKKLPDLLKRAARGHQRTSEAMAQIMAPQIRPADGPADLRPRAPDLPARLTRVLPRTKPDLRRGRRSPQAVKLGQCLITKRDLALPRFRVRQV